MHKGSGPAQRKRKPHNQSSHDQPKKRRIIRNVSEVQSGPALRDGIVPRLTERQQLALAMEESKKAAAALQAKDRRASRQMDSEDEYTDRQEGASESEQDSVSEDESAVKPHRRAIKSAQPARSLTSQHSDVASQLGQHDHKLCAKSGRLESLSGGSKQSQSTSSRLRLSPDSSNVLSSGRPHLHHVNSDADSHPRRATSQARLSTDSGKRSASVERQRTSDLSSRDVLDAAEDGKLKDEMQSEGVAAVSLPLEDGMDLLDKRTQRLALRKALSHTMSLHPETSARLDSSNAPGRLHKLLHAKSDLQATANGFSASPKHTLKALKVRVKSEDKPHQQLNGVESPAAADLVQHKRSRGGTQTPRDHHLSDATPRARSGQHPRTFDATPRSSNLATHLSAPMAQLVESDLFGDFSPRKCTMEPRTSAPVVSPKSQSAAAVAASNAVPAEPEASAAITAHRASEPAAQPQAKSGLKVMLKHHRLAGTDANKPFGQNAPAVAEQPATPAAKPSPPAVQTEVEVAKQVQDKLQEPAVPAPVPAQKVVKRKLGKPGRPRTVSRLPGGSQDVLRSPAADARCQAMAEANHMEFIVPTAGPMVPPETDAQPLEPSSSAAKGRGRARKNAKQAVPTLSTLGSRRLRSTCMEEDTVKSSFLSYDSKKQKGSAIFVAHSLLSTQHEAWSALCQTSTTVSSILDGQTPQPEANTASLVQADSSRAHAALLLQAAAASVLSDLEQQHELEGKVLTSSMMLASHYTAADRPFSRRQASADWCSPNVQTSTEVVKEQPLGFASACASLWAPLQTNRASDQLYESKKWSKDDLTYQDVRSPRRATSHRMYDSGWDDLQARQSCEIGTLQTYQEWCPK